MNDYWKYLAHSEVGGARKKHKYYARVLLGQNKFGLKEYRYFYDAREYGAYMQRNSGLRRNHPTDRYDDHKTTYYTGKSKVLPSEDDKETTFDMLKGHTHKYGYGRVEKTPFREDKHPIFERHTVRPVNNGKIGSAVNKATHKIKKAAAKGKKKVERFVADYSYLWLS